jgi:hypothetical protein
MPLDLHFYLPAIFIESKTHIECDSKCHRDNITGITLFAMLANYF